MSLADFRLARLVRVANLPFDALIMAAAIKAKPDDFEKLRVAFPAIVDEAYERMHHENGILPADPAGAR
jgi:hypothetical protein